MVPLARPATEPHAAQAALARLRCGPEQDLPALLAPPAPRPELRCGGCHALVRVANAQHHVRCGQCRRTLVLPPRIALRCAGCGSARTVRLADLGATQACLICGRALASGDVVLAVRSRRHTHTHHRHAHKSRYGDAVWAVLIVGLSLLFALVVLARL
jgi:ribosomal protein S27E